MFSGADAEILEEGNTDRVQALLQDWDYNTSDDKKVVKHIHVFDDKFSTDSVRVKKCSNDAYMVTNFYNGEFNYQRFIKK